ncbi:cysteine desulfurase, partial [bacterium]|nr:cysteine desulfurase [bacterium]
MKSIYLDYAATCPTDQKVLKKMNPYFTQNYGNESSMHSFGTKAKEDVENARENILKKVNGKEHKLIFTSGGTESNNLALKGIAYSYKEKGKHIITTKIEHDCILNTCKFLEKEGFKVDYLNVDKDGFINLEELKNKITKETILVSVIHGNNEIGTIQYIREIGKICKEKGVFFHTDACQSFCKTEIDLIKDNVDLITINAHKIYGPKGIGTLIIKKGIKLTPLLHGGGHEYNLRSGTLNVPGIIGFQKSINVISKKDIDKMTKIRDY